MSIFLIASVSATDLNATDEISSDEIYDEVISVDNDEVISIEDDDLASLEDNDYLSAVNDSEVLGKTLTISSGADLGSTIGSASSGDTIIINEGSYYIKDKKITKSLTFIGQGNVLLTTNNGGDKSMFLIGADVTFKNIRFQGGSAQWGNIFYVYSGLLTVDNCKFEKGLASKGGGSINCFDSGRCRVLNSQFSSGSISYGGGGAIFIESYGEVINCTFNGNSAEYGGAIKLKKASNSVIDGCTFINCKANHGGAIHVDEGSDAARISNCVFKSCTSSDANSAIDLYNSNQVSIKGCDFLSCSGSWGVIGLWGTVSNTHISDCQFSDCTSNNRGGAIYWEIGTNLNVNNCNFTNVHAASYGGAIEAHSTSNLNILKCNFNDCYSTNDNGGAIHTDTINTVNVKNCNFYNCHAQRVAGSIDLCKASNFNVFNCSFIDSYASNFYGGAICLSLSNTGNLSSCYFDSCNSLNGGAIIFLRSSKTNVYDSTFVNCTAINGGAIRLEIADETKNSEITINNCNFKDNSASNVGGSISSYQTSNLKILNSNFTNSSSKSLGGAVSSCEDNGGCISGCYFDSCNSKDAGGAIRLHEFNKINVANSIFVGCTSVNEGAAIYMNKGSNLIFDSCRFDKCTSENGVSSISFGIQPSNSEVIDCVFEVAPKDITYHYTTKLAANNLSIVKGDSAIINVVLSNKLGPLSKREVIFSVNGNKISKTTDSSGFVSFDATKYLSVSNNEISISYAGDEINNAVSKIVNVKVNLYMGSLNITQSDSNYYGNKSVSIKYTDSKNKFRENVPINIIIYSNGEVFKKDKKYTDSNNMVTYSMSDKEFIPGNYSVYAYVDTENEDITPFRLDNIIISKLSGVIELSKSKSNKTLYVTLVNKTTGDVFSGINVKLQFNRNGYEGNVTTGSDGSKSYSMSDFIPDTYSVTASVDSSGFKEFADADLENIVITSAGKEDSIIEFGNNIVFDYLKRGYTTITKIEGCTIGECVIEGNPDVRVGVNGNKITVYGDNLFGAGTYNLKVTTVPDVDHNAVTKTVKVTVNKIDSSLNLNSVTCNFGDSVTIIPSNMVGCGISYVNVSVVGQKPKIDVINSVITVSGLPAGEHTLKVVTTPDKNYNSVTKTAKITVRKVKSAIGFNPPVSFVYGSVGQIPLTLEGCSIVRESCAVDGFPKAIIDVNKNVVKVSNLSVGSYTLRITSIPDSNHIEDTKDIVFSVTPTASNVDLSPKSITFDYGTTGQANLILDGCTVLSDDVIVEGYSTAITRVADGVLYVSNLPANTYTLQIKTTPDGNHESVTKKFSVTVNKPLSTVEFIGSADFDYLGEGKTTLKLAGCTVSLDDIEVVGYGDAGLTIGKGNIITISELDSGKYTLKVKTNPDSNHRANTATLAFTVNKIDSKISFTKDAISFKYAESGSTPIVLENCKVANMSIVGHDNVKPVLDDDEITVSGLPVGSYVIKVTTDPDDNYNSVDAYINVTVVKNTATITVKKSQTVAYKKSTNWAITLKDSSGKPVSGVKVNLKIYKGNKLYKNVNNLKVTDANGVTNYNTNGLPVGTYKFVVSVSHAGYNVKSVSTPVKVIKQTVVKIILNTKSDKKGAVISVIVKDKAGKKYLNNIKLTLSIKNGKTYNTVTLITGNYKSGKGVSAYSTNMLTVGSHNVKVETADIKYSGSASKNVKVKASAKKYRNWWEKISKGKKTSYGT